MAKLVYALILGKEALRSADKNVQNNDEGHDVEKLPIMGTTIALRPGELWQLLCGR